METTLPDNIEGALLNKYRKSELVLLILTGLGRMLRVLTLSCYMVACYSVRFMSLGFLGQPAL